MNHKGVDPDALPGSLPEIVQRALQPGETIRWLGQPCKEPPGHFAVMMFGGAAVILLLGALIALVFGAHAVFSTPAMILLGILLVILLGIPSNRKRWHYTAYVLTDGRALVVKQGIWFFPPVPMNRSEVTAYGPDRLAGAELLLRPNGEGDVVFETRRYRESSGEGGSVERIERMGFLYLADAAAVRDLTLQVAGAHGFEPEPEPAAAASVSLEALGTAPYLVDPPRRVPFWIQRRLFGGHGQVGMLIVGAVFSLASLILIIPPLLVGDRGPRGLGYYFWRLFPYIHLTVGLGLLSAPLVAWRRRVAVLRHGLLVPVRIVAYQDANLMGPWTPFHPSTFADARWFSDATLLSFVAERSSEEAASTAAFVKGFKRLVASLLSVFALFGIVFGLTGLGFIWFGGNAAGKALGQKVSESLVGLGITGLSVGFPYVMWLMIRGAMAPFEGGVTPENSRMLPTANFRLVFALPDGSRAEAVCRVDLRTRLGEARAGSEDLALYHPGDPQRALLLDAVWPAIRIRDGELE